MSVTNQVAIPELPYAPDALAPVISAETIGFHWGKHVPAYAANLGKLVAGTPFENASLEEMIRKAEGGMFNNAAQVWNHIFYFQSFTPKQGTAPSAELSKAIDSAFGSLDNFKLEFVSKGGAIFGSGWVWLAKDAAGKLSIVQASGAANPLRDGLTPLLVFDVWEHAYYLDYQNRRPDHLSALWSIVDWEMVSKRYQA
jgi:Fe-Mn family superoxide dismutase